MKKNEITSLSSNDDKFLTTSFITQIRYQLQSFNHRPLECRLPKQFIARNIKFTFQIVKFTTAIYNNANFIITNDTPISRR